MNVSKESEILTYALDMAAHYTILYNMTDFVKLRNHYKSYLRAIAEMVHAVDAHIDLRVKHDVSHPEHSFNIWRVYYTYDGEVFGMYYDFNGTHKELRYFY